MVSGRRVRVEVRSEMGLIPGARANGWGLGSANDGGGSEILREMILREIPGGDLPGVGGFAKESEKFRVCFKGAVSRRGGILRRCAGSAVLLAGPTC